MSDRGVYEGAKGDTSFRRTFSTADYADKKLDKDAVIEVTNIRPDELNFEKVVGKTQVVQTTVRNVGFACKACQRVFKDNVSFLDHLTSKEHLVKHGVDPTKKASLQEVKQKLDQLRKKRNAQESVGDVDAMTLLKERLAKREKERREEIQKKKVQKKEQKMKKQEAPPPAAAEDDEMMRMMGFGGFSSTKS